MGFTWFSNSGHNRFSSSHGFIRNCQVCSRETYRWSCCSSGEKVMCAWSLDSKSLSRVGIWHSAIYENLWVKTISPTAYSNGFKKNWLSELPVTVTVCHKDSEFYWPLNMLLWYQSKSLQFVPPLLVYLRFVCVCVCVCVCVTLIGCCNDCTSGPRHSLSE